MKCFKCEHGVKRERGLAGNATIVHFDGDDITPCLDPDSFVDFCKCPCHEMPGVHCSCWIPCCHEPNVQRHKQTPITPKPKTLIKFTTFKPPFFRKD